MMSLYVKSIVLKLCKSSFTAVCKCIKQYPIVSAILFLLFLLYLFIPSLLVFFVYISPLFLLAAAALFYRSRSKAQEAKRNGIKQEKKIEKKLSTLGKSKSVANDRPTVTKPTRSMSQRRNKEKFFVEADPIIAHDVKASISDFLREVRNKRDEEESETTKGKNEQGLCNFLTEIRDSNPKLEIDPPLVNDQNDRGEESGSSEDDKAAVEWNEDDQKNLMDLGISEMERNKRLESLIARRRSRKFYKMNSEKGMIVDVDIVVPCSSPSVAASEIVSPVSISTTRIHHDPLLLLHGSSGDDQFPGSAPSILLPGKNPFDLPYDPHEEKPDLMGDSFQQEFSIAPQMCRHESFSLGHTRPRIHSGPIDEQKPPRHFDPIARTVSVTDLVVTDLLEHRQADDSPPAPGEILQLTSDSVRREEKNVNDQGSEISPNTRPPTLPRPIPKAASASDLSNDASLSIIHNTRVDEHYQNRGTWHTPTNSVASDLQVEVSEVGSPPSTVDSDDDHDGESLTYDGDIEKEANSGSEELWGLSPHAPRIGKHELALRFLNEASEEGMREARYADNVQGFDAEIKQLEKEEEFVDNVQLITRDNKESKETLDPVQVDVEKIDNTEELQSIERQTMYEITDDVSKPVEEIVTEPCSHIERKLLQGPEKLADVIVKRSEQIDSASSSIRDLVDGVEPLHHHDDLGIRDANEASRFTEDVEDSGGGNIRDENVTPSETQSTNSDRVMVMSPTSVSQTLSSLQPEVAIDQDLAYLNSIPSSPVSVLVDMKIQEAQTSPSPIIQQVHDMDADQTPMSHDEQHQPSESSNGEINSHVDEEVPKSFEDITYNPNSYGHDEVATSNASKSEDDQYHLNIEDEVCVEQEDRRLTEEATGESNHNGNVINEGKEGESLSITKEATAEPEIESLLVLKQEPIMELELPKPAHLVPSNDLQGDVIESLRQDATAEIVKPSDLISQHTLEGESLSSVRREAMAESLKEVDMMPTKSLLEEDESMTSMKEAITSMEHSKPIVDSVPPMAVEVDSLASIQLEASKEPLKTDDLMPSLSRGDESLSSVKQFVDVEAHEPADSVSSIEGVQAVPIQTEEVHIETSKPVVEPSLSKNISREEVQQPNMEIEHNVDVESVDSHHNHLQDLNPLVDVDQMDNNQKSKAIDVDGEEEDEGASSTANRQDSHLITNSVDQLESQRVIESKNNSTMIVPP
ncbi:hypothetical protein LINGRAPRIM_LOCUS1599 [Linum grandiflorum]